MVYYIIECKTPKELSWRSSLYYNKHYETLEMAKAAYTECQPTLNTFSYRIVKVTPNVYFYPEEKLCTTWSEEKVLYIASREKQVITESSKSWLYIRE